MKRPKPRSTAAMFAALLQGGSGDLQETLPVGIFPILVFPKLRTCGGESCSDEVMIKTPVVVCCGGSCPAFKVRMCHSARAAPGVQQGGQGVCVQVLSAVLAPQVST